MQANEQVSIRAARPDDAGGIYQAHTRSIRVVCARDYATEQIEAWAGRPFVEGFWEE